MFPLLYDSTYVLVVIGAVLVMIVQLYLTNTFNKYQNVTSKSGLTATEACKIILSNSNIDNVQIGHVAGNLTDHYAPTRKILNLSDTTYNSKSIASIGVAAHEVGHAIQDYKKMFLLNFQMSIVPVVNFASRLSMPAIFIGIILSEARLIELGIMLFGATLFYQIITLPIEYNASHNAIEALRESRIMDEDELYGVRKVLNAAALTYVAAAASSMLQLLRFVILLNGNRRND